MTSPNACAYGRAAMTRSIARFIFDVATISIVRVILRVFSTDLMRPLSSRPLAIGCHPEERREPALRSASDEREDLRFASCLTNRVFDGRPLLARARALLVCLDAAPQIRFYFLRQVLRLPQ